MHVLDLFSGIGGFSLGLERAGMTTTAFCEIDPYCRKVLARHWPSVKIHEDIKQLDGEQYDGSVDLVCGGYPCQPFSVAGKQLGRDDPRHLWPEMHRIIRQARPRWVIAENVRGHVKLGFDEVAAQLEDDGFTVWPFIVPACAVDAPHRRERLWIVGYSKLHGSSTATFPRIAVEASNHDSQRQESPGKPSGASRPPSSSNVADTASPGLPIRQQSSLGSPPGHTESERQDCIGREWWASEPDVGRVANGIPNRVDRIRALGNAVVPQIPELIGRAIMAYEDNFATAA